MTDSRRLLLTVLLVAGCSSRSIPAPLHHLSGVSSPSPVQNPPLGNPAIVWSVKIDAGVSAFTLCTAAGKCVNVKAIADYILDAGLNGT